MMSSEYVRIRFVIASLPAALSRPLSGLASLLAPLHCAVCAGPVRHAHEVWGFGLCRGCARALTPLDAACHRCGASRGPHAEWTSRCGRCRARGAARIGRTLALLRYRGAGRKLMHRLKYGGRQEAAGPLGEHLGRRVQQVWDLKPGTVVVPVPLHWRRQRTRGFDQAERIAAGVARALELPLHPALRRRKHTAPLFRVEPELRGPLLEGVFTLRWGVRRALRDRHVILVDDIRTSGATLESAAQALTPAGVRSVRAAVVAR